VIDRAFDVLLAQLEKRKFAATSRPRGTPRPSTSKRHIPAAVKRAVRERDGDCCTFVGESGHRCGERRHLQFDHIIPVARDGQSTVENLRMRCRAHNLYEAERLFGTEFMAAKREALPSSRAQSIYPGAGFSGDSARQRRCD
jgi:5-methylcytosine-specific restriction endonuclease McrA